MSDFKAKMHHIRFSLGLRPRPRWGSLQCSPKPPIAVFKGPTSKRKGRERRKWGGKGKVREGRTACRKFLATPLLDLDVFLVVPPRYF